MQRCLELASLGLGHVAPNPMVGSVIVHNNKIIGEGYHKKYGGPHAEINAIESVKDRSLLTESTLYVNLEPCAHFGKTPPCSDRIVKENIPRVVIGSIDDNSLVAGKGIEKMKKAGVDVTLGILENECLNLNKRFFTYHREKRPYIILKWAESHDGFMDIERNPDSSVEPYWISNQISRTIVHKLRASEQAILVGVGTVKSDNPSLTTRDYPGKNPVRILLDPNLRLEQSYAIFNDKAQTLVFNKIKDLESNNIRFIKVDKESDYLDGVLNNLYNLNIQSVIVEGGKLTLQEFINMNLWDEAHVYKGQRVFIKGLVAPSMPVRPNNCLSINNDRLYIYKNFQQKDTTRHKN